MSKYGDLIKRDVEINALQATPAADSVAELDASAEPLADMPKQNPESKYGALIARDLNVTQSSVYHASQEDPATASEAVRLGSKLGQPPSVVAADLPSFKTEEKRADWSNTLKAHPHLNELMQDMGLASRAMNDATNINLLGTVAEKGFVTASKQLRKQQDEQTRDGAIREIIGATRLDYNQAEGLFENVKAISAKMREAGSTNEQIDAAINTTIGRFGTATVTPTTRLEKFKQDMPMLSSLVSGFAGYAGGAAGLVRMAQRITPSSLVADAASMLASGEDMGVKLAGDGGTLEGVQQYFGGIAERFSTDTQRQSFAEARAAGKAGEWIASQVVSNAPSILGSGFAALSKTLAPVVLKAMGGVEAGGTYGELLDRGYSEAVALPAAAGSGLLEMAFERLPIKAADEMRGAWAGLAPEVRADFAQRMMHALSVSGVMAGTESLEEGGTTATQNVVRVLAAALQEQVGGATAETTAAMGKGIFDNVLGSMLVGAASSGVHSPLLIGQTMLYNEAKIEAIQAENLREAAAALTAQNSAQTLEQLSKIAASSDMVKNGDTEAYAQFLQKMTAQVGVESVYVPANELLQITDAATAETWFPSVKGKIEEAAARGQRIEIPASEFILATRDGDAGTQLRQIASTELYGMSAAEAEQFFTTGAQELQDKVKAIQEGATDVQLQEALEVTENVSTQLKATGMFTPTQVKYYTNQRMAFYTTMAQRAGMTVKEMYAKDGYMLKLQAESGVPTMADSYDQNGELVTDSPQFQSWFGESKVADDGGKPIVVSHGGLGANDITQFEKGYGGQNTGNNEHGAFHFTNDTVVADDYGRQAFIRRYQDDPESLKDDGYVPQDFDFDTVDVYEFVADLAEKNIGRQDVYLKIENPIVIDMEGERVDVDHIERLSRFAMTGEDDTGEFFEKYADQIYSEYDQGDVADFKDEIEQRARDEFGIDQGEEIEPWQLSEATDMVMQDNGYEREQTPVDGIIIKNMIDDIGDASNKIADQYIVFDPNQIKSVNNDGSFSKFDDNIYNQSLSSRLPSAVKATEDPLASVLNISHDVTMSDPVTLDKNIIVLQDTPNVRKLTGKGAKDPARNIEAIIEHMANNLLWLHDQMPEDWRARAHLWYDGGRKTIEAWGKRYGISEMQGAGVIAVLSPQNGWYANVSQAERILDLVFGLRDFRWDEAMTSTYAGLNDSKPELGDIARGKTLGELLDNPPAAARWIRAYDQTYNNRAYRILTPEGGASDYVKTGKGVDSTMMWKSFNTIAKAVSIAMDGRAENISYQLGKEHKVRNFYNNIFDPNSPLGFATIDTHAVAAAWLRPLSSADTEVGHAFGSGAGSSSSSMTGLNGTYPIYLEAYRRAAQARGIMPREMQSITWEAIRGLFEAAKKSGLKKHADEIWTRYKSGVITQEQAQQEILDLAGGITAPSWTGVPYNDVPSPTYEGPARDAIAARGDALNTPARNEHVSFEVAPDPNNEALTAAWDSMDYETKRTISQSVVAKILPEVLKELGTSGQMSMDVGGYMGHTNPSITLKLERPELTMTAAKMLGYALSQDSMMAVSDQPANGMEPTGVVTITLPEGYGEDQVKALYDSLWTIEENGSRLIGGHSTADGHMAILNFTDLTTDELAQRIHDHLGGDASQFDVKTGTVYTAFPDKEHYGYGQTNTGGKPSTKRTSVQRRVDSLRAEATRLVAEGVNLAGVLYQGFAGSGARLRVGGAEVGARYGQAREGSSSVVGVHYSGAKRDTLTGEKYGTGMQGAEARRVQNSFDDRLRKRIHFYVDDGNGVQPESGVGRHVHAVHLDNMYDAKADPLGLVPQAPGDANKLETMILDAGFDGYYVRGAQGQQGVAVLLGNHSAVAPDHLGTHQEAMGYAQTFYSPLSQAFVNAKQSTMPGTEWAKWLKSNQAKLGLKADEIEWTGLNEYLDLRGKDKVTREEIVQFLNDNGIKLETRTLGADNEAHEKVLKDNGYSVEGDQFGNKVLYYDIGHGVKEQVGAIGNPGTDRDGVAIPQDVLDAFFSLEKSRTNFGPDSRTHHWAKQFTKGIPGTYREVLVKLPIKDKYPTEFQLSGSFSATFSTRAEAEARLDALEQLAATEPSIRAALDRFPNNITEVSADKVGKQDFNSKHWRDDPNVVVHLRYDETLGKDGKRYLRVGEIQSDWGQEGRDEGFVDPQKQKLLKSAEADRDAELKAIKEKYGENWRNDITLDELEVYDELVQKALELEYSGSVPAGPFVQDTKLWVSLGIKQAIKIAAEKGVDGIVFGTGKQNADMYDLSKQVDRIVYDKNDDGTYNIRAERGGEAIDGVDKENLTIKQVEDIVGKDVAEKIESGEGRPTIVRGNGQPADGSSTYLSGLDLKVGGKGMIKFYEEIVPQVANTVLKQLGAGKTTRVALGTEPRVTAANNGKAWGVTSVDGYINDIRYDTQAEARAAAAEYSKTLGAIGFEITPELRKLAESGLPLYQDQQVSRGTFSPSTGVTKLTHAANLSTFLHESGHQYLEIMADLASQPDAAPGIAADMQTILEWMGVPDLATWNAMSLEEKRPHHEKWAETFETYLYTGKAPSTKLQEAFKAFAGWLRKIYGQIRGDVAPEIRDVMDRMLASEAEIENANKRMGESLFATAESAGMTDEQWLDYKADERERVESAIEQHQRRRLRDMKWLDNAKTKAMRRLQREAKEARAGIRAEVERDVSGMPVYRAGDYIRYGKIVGDDGAESFTDQTHKLSIEALTDMYAGTTMGSMGLTPAKWEILGRTKNGMLSTDGLHPDMIAGSFGYESGDAMVRALVEAPPMNEVIKARVDERMMDENAELATPEAIEESATEALHNDAHLKFLSTEHTALANLIGARKVPLSAIKQAARDSLGGTKLVDIKPHVYVQAERRAAKAAEKAMREGNLQEAANEKMAQLINSALITMAYEQKAETKKRIANINVAFAPDKRLAKNRDMNLVNAARAIISANGMGANKGWLFVDPMSHLDKVKAYEPETYNMLAAAIAPVIRNSKPVAQMTLDEFNSFADIVDQILTLSRSSKQMMIDGQMIERKDAVDAMVAAMEPHFTDKPRAGIDEDVRELDKLKFDFGSWMSALRRVESWITMMDGGPTGPFRTYLYTPVREATEKYRTKSEVYLRKYRDLLATVDWGKNEKIAAPEIGYTFTNGKASLLHALLHTGNDSNKQKLLIGRGWGQLTADGQLDSTRFDAMIARMIDQGILTKTDFDFAQGVWDLMESMKPAAQKAHKRLYGYFFNEITATPFINKFGTYAGGYVPASTDGYIVQDAAINEAQESLFGDGSFMWPSTGSGFTKERVAGYNKPLALDVRMLASHIDKALRFAYIQPTVQDASKVVNNPSFKSGMEKIDTTAIVDMLMPWLQRAAAQVVDTPAKSKYLNRASRFFRWARSTTGMTIMFANVTNTIQQLTGFSIAALRVKPASLAKASIQYNISPIDSAKFITGSSEFMKNRTTTSVMDIQRDIRQIVLDPSMAARGTEFVRAHAYFMQTAAQSYVDNIVWLGAYRDATDRGSDHTDAVRQADSAVRETQGSFNPEDVSAIEVGSPFYRMFMMFAGYFNMQANILATDFKNTIRQNGLRHGYGRLLYIYTMGFAIPAIMSEIIVRAMSPADDDEEENYANTAFQYLLMPQLRTATAMVPGVGPLAMSVVNRFDDKWYNDRLTLSPVFSVGDKAIGGVQAAYELGNGLLTGEQFDEDMKKGDVREMLTLMAVLTGLPPLAAAGKPIGYMMDVNSGATEPTGPVDFARGLATGR